MSRNETPETGKVITVRGVVEPDDLGVVLPHEHLLEYLITWFEPPPHDVSIGSEDALVGLPFTPVTFENAKWVRQNPFNNRDNLINADWRFSAAEVRRFKLAGGRTVVDSSSIGCGRDVWALGKIADDVGLHIIAGSGYYVDAAHPWDTESKTVDDIAAEIVRDIARGAEGTDSRCGLIGEIGTSDPITDREWRVLRAAALAHHETGAGIQVHSLHEMRLAPKILDFLVEECEVHPTRIAMCHLDLVLDDWEYTRRIAEYGVFVEYDTFGNHRISLAQKDRSGVWLSDEDRMDMVERLIDAGYGQQILLSQDLGLRARMAAFGGCGYDFVLSVILPSLRERGIAVETLLGLVSGNPQRFLALARESPPRERQTP